ncbi:class I adenylate-forming enzyme family protein [Legionella bononiensis]|uniref:Acyl-CoA synthetase n=1 Tax=Legionella bononiensis TaxID=2793102 RepID=A0ABS1WC19_9GAMM|nr:acyl-CoA synthetase [Legionella bononiensis]MBL7479166.1 acyl-CoA synthetase [Legionella bononiensis]MBL7526902.1 acyl-CoA synthetase [Legionella bononiensis]MBL7563816.1 acyl-CoA synthetase [Legionella bononiensis]
MKLNVTEYVLRHHQQRQNHPALLLVDDVGLYQSISYSQLYHDVCCLIAGLKRLGVLDKSIVCIQADDVYDLILLFFACNGLGWIPCLLLNHLSEDETDYILQDTQAALFFCLKTETNPITNPAATRTVGQKEFQELKAAPVEPFVPQTHFNDPAFLFYTSGSSGHPKGVLHAQHAILARELNIRSWLTLTAEDRVMQTDNLCWTYSMYTGLLDPLMVGATAVIIKASNNTSLAESQITPEQWLRIIDFYQVSILTSTPDILQSIAASNLLSNYPNLKLRQVGAAGSMMMEKTQDLWINQFHFPIYIALGMSEISTFISTGPNVPYRKNKLGIIQPGRKVAVVPIECREQPVPADTPGMLAIHRDELGLMIGYLHDTDPERHYRGDWFLTQDIVSMDKEGYIEYLGRADLIIKVNSGFRVSPLEIEHVLNLHPQVIDSACGARLEPNAGSNQIIAYVVVNALQAEVVESIIHLLKEHLTDYKIPNQLYFVTSIPRSNRNKILRNELGKLVPIQVHSIEI